jgi:hypothetical protein
LPEEHLNDFHSGTKEDKVSHTGHRQLLEGYMQTHVDGNGGQGLADTSLSAFES